MKRICFSDTETFSETPIKHGTDVYTRSCEVMVWAYAFDNGPVTVWDRTANKDMPADLAAAIEDPECLFVFHNSMFDRNAILHGMGIDIPAERIEDTMVRALAHSLPGSLETLCEVMSVDADKVKDPRGKELIRLFCMPRPKNQKIRRFTRETHPTEWQEFLVYARYDIEAMRAIYNKLPSWNYRDGELDLWRLDQRINDRGFLVDRELAECAIDAVAKAQARLAARTNTATYGFVESATKRDKLLRFILEAYGVDLPDMQSSTLERRLNDPDLPKEVHELLAIRLEASKSSTSKYKALIQAVSPDDRLRCTLQFCGASRTGRDAGRTFQPQNLRRPSMKQWQIDAGIEAIKANCADLVFDNIMDLASNAVRGCIIAPPGMKLVVSDLSNIEGRFAAWVAGEDWKLNAFSQYDAGVGADLYRVAYGKSFNIDISEVDGGEEKGPHRQIGKVMELMLQYEGGVGAFVTGAATYGIDLDEMAEAAWPVVPDIIKLEAEQFFQWTLKKRRSTFGLEPLAFKSCDALKRLWREAHPAISSMWPELKNTVILAISNPGVPFPCRKLTIRRDGAWLRIILPSGRALCYPSPRVDEKGQISYMGVNPYTRQWSRIKTYGGKILENVVQSGARDVFVSSWRPAEDEGYEIVLRVHDELITQAPDNDNFNPEGLSEIMSRVPSWAYGLPLAAGGFESYRYKKE